MPPKSGTQIRTQASAEIGCARVESLVYWRGSQALRCAIWVSVELWDSSCVLRCVI